MEFFTSEETLKAQLYFSNDCHTSQMSPGYMVCIIQPTHVVAPFRYLLIEVSKSYMVYVGIDCVHFGHKHCMDRFNANLCLKIINNVLTLSSSPPCSPLGICPILKFYPPVIAIITIITIDNYSHHHHWCHCQQQYRCHRHHWTQKN
jgi:hypothetical protein